MPSQSSPRCARGDSDFPNTFLSWLDGLQAQATRRRHRYVITLAGARQWSTALLAIVFAQRPAPTSLWVGEAAAAFTSMPGELCVTRASETVRHLGQEYHRLVYDAWAGLEPDALAAAVGTLRAGAQAGLMFLCCPPLASWPDYSDPEFARITVAPYAAADVGRRFVTRLVSQLQADPFVAIVGEDQALPPLPAVSEGNGSESTQDTVTPPCCSGDQQAAVAAIEKVITGQRRRPTVLVADRGRGKSAALGIASARLLQTRLDDIVVTGPSIESVQAVLQHAAVNLPGAQRHRQTVRQGAKTLRFVAPDVFLREAMHCDLLLVDEAAAIPTHLLVDLLRIAPRVAFATTVHGYEGTGRGFALRFRGALDTMTRGWREVRLETPVRWAGGDPLEHFLFNALLLDAEPGEDAALAEFDMAACRVAWLDRDALAAKETELSQLFGLLVSAHYRTRPDDLRYLLDGPNIAIVAAYWRDQVVGTALVAEEGGFSPEDACRIGRGDIRPHGHLLPETLSVHLGLEDAACLSSFRILRIAVHHGVRRHGVASRLLEQVRRRASDAGMDFLGASFGATPGLVHFWNACGFSNVRASLKRGGTTALHSALVLAPVSGDGTALLREARRRFLDLFPHQLCDSLSQLDAALVHALLQGSAEPLQLSHTDHEMLKAYIAGQGLYEISLAAIWRLTAHALTRADIPVLASSQEWAVLIERVMQKRDWRGIAERHGLAGRRAVDVLLRKIIGTIYADYWRQGLMQTATE